MLRIHRIRNNKFLRYFDQNVCKQFQDLGTIQTRFIRQASLRGSYVLLLLFIIITVYLLTTLEYPLSTYLLTTRQIQLSIFRTKHSKFWFICYISFQVTLTHQMILNTSLFRFFVSLHLSMVRDYSLYLQVIL